MSDRSRGPGGDRDQAKGVPPCGPRHRPTTPGDCTPGVFRFRIAPCPSTAQANPLATRGSCRASYPPPEGPDHPLVGAFFFPGQSQARLGRIRATHARFFDFCGRSAPVQ
ncbi:hypothetical protein HXXDennis_69 [Xanthomonas phage HXX_Dennis]|nr:hypothetical protein HXXDennis_69 [Xanthomonas phage HXX_Dennis]